MSRAPLGIQSRIIKVHPECVVVLPLPKDEFQLAFQSPSTCTDAHAQEQVYFRCQVAPRPSNGEYCPVCMETTEFGTPRCLIFTFPCKHAICWQCALQWAANAPDIHTDGLSCPMCRDNAQPGNYYEGEGNINIDVWRFSSTHGHHLCSIASLTPFPQIQTVSCMVEIIYDSRTGAWSEMYEERTDLQTTILGIKEAFVNAFPNVAALLQECGTHRCFVCGKQTTRRCVCRAVYYCSTTCQRLHYKHHKQECKTMRLAM